jgi:hypothetical protein
VTWSKARRAASRKFLEEGGQGRAAVYGQDLWEPEPEEVTGKQDHVVTQLH